MALSSWSPVRSPLGDLVTVSPGESAEGHDVGYKLSIDVKGFWNYVYYSSTSELEFFKWTDGDRLTLSEKVNVNAV